MERQLVRGQGKAEDLISYSEAFALAYSGHMQQARRMSQRASDLAQQSGRPEKSALFQTGAALSEAFFGYAPVARRKALAALEVSKDREVEYGAAVALALSGDTSQSRTLTNDLERRFPEDTSVRFNYTPTLRALLALDRGEPAKAVEQLQIAVPYELGAARSLVHGRFRRSTRSMCSARPTWSKRRAPKPPMNFGRFSVTAGLWSAIRWGPWPTFN